MTDTQKPRTTLGPATPARTVYRAPGSSITLRLAPADVDALDPERTGSFEFFGMTVYRVEGV